MLAGRWQHGVGRAAEQVRPGTSGRAALPAAARATAKREARRGTGIASSLIHQCLIQGHAPMTPHPLPPVPRHAAFAPERPTLIVLCHLRWSFVFQRPQHLLTRLARDVDVVFVEEPVFAEGPPRLDSSRPVEGIDVLTPRTSRRAPGFADEQLAVMGELLQAFVKARGIHSPIVWLYTPMALPLVDALAPRALVYDCMDDLASFKFAPPSLATRERLLLERADVVLAGGPSLHEARRAARPDALCLPSAVDIEHFSPANLRAGSEQAVAVQALHAGLHAPRIGFYGVIDERLDLELVAGVADARPDWQLVMVGPVVKIDPESLPRRPNIRWIGMQAYEALPYLLAQWDVAILPFALNEATRFISPTKTLEYMAAGVPVVSTAIRDVATLYGEVVSVATGVDEFVGAVLATLEMPADRRRQRDADCRRILRRSTWDVAAARALEALRPFFQPAARTVEAQAATGSARQLRKGLVAGDSAMQRSRQRSSIAR
jgi:glycosyltransferase involved in cell wall biosynthesis